MFYSNKLFKQFYTVFQFKEVYCYQVQLYMLVEVLKIIFGGNEAWNKEKCINICFVGVNNVFSSVQDIM